MKLRKFAGFGCLALGMVMTVGSTAYASDQTTTTVGVDDGSGSGGTPVFTIAAGGAMDFADLDLSQEPTNGLYEIAAVSTADVKVDDRRGLNDGETDLPWRVQAKASELKTAADVVLPTTSFKLSMGTPTTATGNAVSASSDVEIIGAASNVGTATVGRGKTSFAPATAKVNIAETAVTGDYTGTITYTLISGL